MYEVQDLILRVKGYFFGFFSESAMNFDTSFHLLTYFHNFMWFRLEIMTLQATSPLPIPPTLFW